MREERKYAGNVTHQTTIIAEHMADIRRLYNGWKKFYMDYFEAMHDVSHYVLERELDEFDRPRKVRGTLGAHVFAEIAKLWYFTQRPVFLLQGKPDKSFNEF